MKIDFSKLIELLLPTPLRRPRLFALLRTLISKPLQSLFSRFYIWREKSRYEVSVTPQVCVLIHAVERTFDCVCEIQELDGKPYDFFVSIDRSTDLNAIREFVDRHKLAGKSYIFKLGDVNFVAEWFNYVNEDIIELYIAEWDFYVNEDDGVNNIRVFLGMNADGNTWFARATADKAVKSDLYISISVSYRMTPTGMLHHGGGGSINLLTGETTKEEPISMTIEPGAIVLFTANVFPGSDDFYTYTVIGGGEIWH